MNLLTRNTYLIYISILLVACSVGEKSHVTNDNSNISITKSYVTQQTSMTTQGIPIQFIGAKNVQFIPDESNN